MRVGGRALRGPPPGCVDHAGAGQAAGVVVTVVLHQLGGFQAGRFGFGRRRAGPDERGHAVVLGGRQADVHVGAERAGDLVAEQPSRRGPGDPADHLADQEAEGVDVVAVGGAGRPPGILSGQRGGHGRPVQHGARREPAADGGQPGLVGQQLPDGDRVLARGGELRPAGSDRGIEVEPALPGQAGRAGGDQALADREHVDQRVRLPAAAAFLVGPAAVQVRDDAAVDHDADRGAPLAAFGEIGAEGVAQRLEPRIAVAFDRLRHSRSQMEMWAGSSAACTERARSSVTASASSSSAQVVRTVLTTDHGRG